MHSGKLSFIFSILISILCAYQLAKLTWQVHEIFNSQASYSPLTSDPRTVDFSHTNSRPIEEFVTKIIKHNIFGSVPKSTTPPPIKAEPSKIKKTHLNIDLLGLIKGNQSVAIIRFEENQQAYRIGDYIQKKDSHMIEVTAIEENHVIILNKGVPERLLLPLKNISEAGIAIDTTPSQNIIDLHSENIKAFIGDDVRDALMVDPFSFSALVSFSPYLQGSILHGYRIVPGEDKRLLQELGLSNSDVVIRINNVPVSNLNESMFNELLQNIDPITITLERNGQPINMDIIF